MGRRVLGAVCLALVAGVALSAQSKTPSLVGTWTLISVERANADGKMTAQPLPRGSLIFDRVGHAFELVETGRRTPYAGNQPTPAEALAAKTAPVTICPPAARRWPNN